MQLPGMRVQDAYRLAHYDESLHRAAQAVEQGVVRFSFSHQNTEAEVQCAVKAVRALALEE